MTSKRDNDTPAQPQTQAMGAATRDPRSENPVELTAISRLMTSQVPWGVEDK